jgi:acetylornithine aminotransferase
MRCAVDPATAAIVPESLVQGEAGVRPAPPGYLRRPARSRSDTGALLVLDE